MVESVQFGVTTEDKPILGNGESRSALRLLSLPILPQTLKGIALAATLQLTGINAIMYFGPKIIESAGFNNPNMLNIVIGAWNFVTTFIAAALVDRVPRKYLISVGTAVMALALLVTGICLSPVVPEGLGRTIGVGIGLIFFIAGFEGGVGCLFWILANEVFDKEIREAGATMSNVFQWGFNLIVSSFFLTMFEQVGEAITFYIFGGVGVVCTVILFFFLSVHQPKMEKANQLNKHHNFRNK